MRPLLRLPLRGRRPRVQTYNGSIQRFTLDAGWARRLKEFCEEEKCTLFMALMAAFASLLAKYSGQSEVVIGYPVANRHRKELESLVGFFVNTLVMCLEIDARLSFRQLLQKIRLKTLEATNNQDYPFDKLVERLNPKRNLSYAPVFQVMLSVHHDQQPEMPPGFNLTPLRLTQTAGAKFDLNLIAEASTEQLSLAFEYNTDLFDAAMMQRLTMHLKVVVETMLVRPEQSLGRLSLLTANEERLFSSWNNTQLPENPARSVDELFECRVKEPPAYAAPGTPTEVELAGLWSALLPVEKPGIDDDFFDLGGHSLLVMELVAKIQDRFGMKLPVTELFERNTIRQVALTIDKIIQLRMEVEGDLLEEEGGQITRI